MRVQVWNNMVNVRFKAFYCDRCSSLAGAYGEFLSIFLSLASAGFVAAWAVWREYPGLWALIVVVAQVLQIVRPHIRFLKSEKDFLAMSFDFRRLYLSYEQLWYDLEHKALPEGKVREKFQELREKEINIEQLYRSANTPEWTCLMRKSQRDTNVALALDFDIEVKNEQRETTGANTATPPNATG